MSSSPSELAEVPSQSRKETRVAAATFRSQRQQLGDRMFRDIRNVFRPWLRVCTAFAALLPDFTFPRLRSGLLRAGGCDLCKGVAVMGRVVLVGSGKIAGRLHIGEGAVVAPGVTFGLDADITLGRNVSISPGVVLYTATHTLGYGSQRMSPYTSAKPIVIGDGAWVGMNSLILPGVTLGRGCVISAGSVVTSDVAANTLAAGNPAEARSTLPFGDR